MSSKDTLTIPPKMHKWEIKITCESIWDEKEKVTLKLELLDLIWNEYGIENVRIVEMKERK